MNPPQTPLWLGLLGPGVALVGVAAAWHRAGKAMHLQQRVHWELIHPKDSLYQLVNRGTRTAFGTEYHLSSGVIELWDAPTQRDPRVVLGGGSFEFVGSIPDWCVQSARCRHMVRQRPAYRY